MKLNEDILNGKHFPLGSRERLKATLISLMLLLAIMIMLIDVYESISQGYYAISVIEGTSAIIFCFVYALFPQKLSLQTTIHMALPVIGFLFIISLTIHGANPQFALFWLSTLPVYIFFFLGVKRGLTWTIVVVTALLITAVNAIFKWYPPLYTVDFLIQLTVGYIAISYLLYSLEKERQGYEESLLSTVKDKEILLKEVHHRTKNNMQIMIGLLDTQSFKIDDPKYKKMFQSHVDRLKAMSSVHEHLYIGKTYETVEIDTYLDQITQNLQGLSRHNIVTDIDAIVLDMRMAMNLGLVFNEAVSNAIEHAYEDDEVGEIKVSLKRRGDEKCLLIITDHGKGYDNKKTYKTLGITLMKDISTSLHNENIEIQSDQNGTEVKIYCSLEKDIK